MAFPATIKSARQWSGGQTILRANDIIVRCLRDIAYNLYKASVVFSIVTITIMIKIWLLERRKTAQRLPSYRDN